MRTWWRWVVGPALALGACGGDSGGATQGPDLEVYAVRLTKTEDTCFHETGSTVGGSSPVGFVFEEDGGVWTAQIDEYLPALPCEGPREDFSCAMIYNPPTTTIPGDHTYTLAGARDDERIDATMTIAVSCPYGTTGCAPCQVVSTVKGQWYDP